jgi:hypothetical protein
MDNEHTRVLVYTESDSQEEKYLLRVLEFCLELSALFYRAPISSVALFKKYLMVAETGILETFSQRQMN